MKTETKVTVIGYTTAGSIRGQCGHLHRTESAARRCLDADQTRCGRLGGGRYSDRRIVEVGSDGYLYHDLATDDWLPNLYGGDTSGAERFSRNG